MIAARPKVKLEPVSPRLKASLMHPNRTGAMLGVRYSPDGKRIIAGDYPGGVLIVWDATTGKQLTKIQTRTTHFHVSPDWKTVYSAFQKKRAFTRIEKGGKQLLEWHFDSEVRAWDLATGKLRRTFKHDPPRGINTMEFSPDGSTFVTGEELSGVWESGRNHRGTLWDVRTGKPRPLPENWSWPVLYSPDGKTLVGSVGDEKWRRAIALKWIDTATAKVKLSIPIADNTMIAPKSFSPDGRLLIGMLWRIKTQRQWLKFWDKSGKELASFEPAAKDKLTYAAPSPDGKALAATTLQGEESKLFLFDLSRKKLVTTVILGEKAIVRQPRFSPDGKWIAVVSRVLPDSLPRPLNAEDAPQPRIHLVDVAAGKLRETLVAPQCFATSLCFSPDGKTLATGGHGKVLLWDLTRPPGAAENRSPSGQ